MAVFGVSVTKELGWRGGVQPFSNVYHYETAIGEIFDDLSVIEQVSAAERAIHGGDVSFVGARTWGPTDQGQEASVTREIVDLNFIGSATTSTSMYQELAIMVFWPLGRYGSRNRPQFLRKWLHTCAIHGYPPTGKTGITATPAAIRTYLNAVTSVTGVTSLSTYELCTSQGRVPVAQGEHYPYLEHRQFGDQWR